MNVAIFTDNDFGKVNGVTTTLRAVLDHAPPQIRPRIYTCDDHGVDTPEYLAMRSPGMGIPFYREMKIHVPPFRRFLQRALADRIDVVHYTTPGPVGLAAQWVAARGRLPMVGSFHTDLAEYARLLSGSRRLGDLMREYLRWAYSACQHILVPSAATQDTLVRGRIDPSRIGIWRRGVATDRFTPARRSEALRAEWAVSDTRPALLYVGRLSKEKGLGLLEALRRALHQARVAHRFVLVGDGPMRADLQAALPDAIFTGTLSPNDVAIAMASSDLFLFPSRTDTAGNVVLEAQACGLPVLVTNAGGPQENMIDGETGHVCGEPLDFVRHTASLCHARRRRLEFGAAARRYALSRSWEAALAPLYQAYLDAARAPVVQPIGARRSAA
jgi:glycosyltransferase involved in cell wall biosynthesis